MRRIHFEKWGLVSDGGKHFAIAINFRQALLYIAFCTPLTGGRYLAIYKSKPYLQFGKTGLI